jgi:tRNA(Ile)-lysidine synthase
VLGHHLDDQVETVLFRMLRGTGLKGLSGMDQMSTFGDKIVLRPLFTLAKSDILKRLNDRGIKFITDNSNEDNAYSRNYIRNSIIPKMLERWPAGSKNIARMAQLARQQSNLLIHLLEDNLKAVSDESGLSIEGLKQYDAFHRSELIRMWLDRNDYASPNESQMREIEKSFFQSRQEANPVIKFQREDGQKKGVILTKVNNYILPEELDE